MDKIKQFKQTSTHDGILFLQGVFKKDCQKIEDMLKGKLMSNDPLQQQESISFDKIPIIFNNLQEWPTSTNIACWFCTRFFKGRPWFAPQTIEPKFSVQKDNNIKDNHIKETKEVVIKSNLKEAPTKEYVISVQGVFCCANCVMAYILLHTTDLVERLNKIAMLKFIYELFMGRPITHIHPSPSPYNMVQYGGSWTPTVYQQKIDMLDNVNVIQNNDDNFNSICNIYIQAITE